MGLMRKISELCTVAGTYAIDLAASVAMSLALPVFVSLETYATLRVYLLYISFVSVLNLGFNDGVYVKYGAYDYDKLPKSLIGSFIRHVAIQGTLFGIIIALVGAAGMDPFIAVFLGINLFVLNLNGLFVFINQFTRRFAINLANNLLSKGIQVILVVLVIATRVDNPYVIIGVITISNTTCLCLNAIKNSELLKRSPIAFAECKEALAVCYKSGLAIMVGYYSSQLILSASQFAASSTCSTESFAYFSFAFSIMNFLNVFINSVSAWLYPSLKRVANSPSFFQIAGMVNIVCAFGMVALLGCGFALVLFVSFAIPKYEGSIEYFFVLFPSVAFSGAIRMVLGNMYKVCEKERRYMALNLFSAGIAVALVIGASFAFPGQAAAIAFTTTLSVVIQYILLVFGIKKSLDTRSFVMGSCALFVGSAAFVGIAHLQTGYLAMMALYSPIAIFALCSAFLVSKKEIEAS